jgi:hypothetical protein
MRITSSSAAAVLALALAASSVATADTALAAPTLPPTLQGETLTGSASQTTATTCQLDLDDSGEATFTASGVAVGPYPGTFTETGTYSFGAVVNPNGFGVVTSFHSTFAITSATGSVSGTKDLAGPAPASFATCANLVWFLTTPLEYQATITTTSGAFRDSGTATATTATGTRFQLDAQAFAEDFLTSNGVVPLGPQTKDDCKDGGYLNYGFRNQGECIAAVNH